MLGAKDYLIEDLGIGAHGVCVLFPPVAPMVIQFKPLWGLSNDDYTDLKCFLSIREVFT